MIYLLRWRSSELDARICDLEHLIISFYEVKLDILLDVVWEALYVCLVRMGEDKCGQALSYCCHRLFFYTTDFQYLAIQWDLSCHAQTLKAGLLES